MTQNKSWSVTSEYDSQKGFLIGIFIDENTRMIYDECN